MVPQKTDGRLGVSNNRAEQNYTEGQIEKRTMPDKSIEADRCQEPRQRKQQQQSHDGKDQQCRNEHAVDVKHGEHAMSSLGAGSPAKGGASG